MTDPNVRSDYDAIVIGAGFGGIYMLHKLRNELGLSARAFDRAGGVGGTWYWNRYPGALSDTEGFVYRYSFDRELLQESEWKTRYLTQPEILAYLEGVVDRYDLAQDIQLNTGVESAHFDESRGVWGVRTDTGETFTAKYLVTALGLLSAINLPNLKGRDLFEGELYHSGAWPETHDFTGKRVGVIGTGSTGIQLITALAPQVEHLTVFQRSPQYSVPAGNGPLAGEVLEALKANYDKIWDDVRSSSVAFGFQESSVPAMSVSEEECRKVFQESWDIGGGFRFMFGTFCDVATDPAANEAAASFIRSKIAEIVEDPETARKLTPTDLYAKRPICDSGYYATFNRDNVSLVSVKETPIVEMIPKGIRTEDGIEHELDVLVFATGFDAVDGNYTRMDIRGREGESINSHWQAGPASYLGVSTTGFPNMFMILGPNGPFTNLPPSIEAQVEWITNLIGNAESGTVLTVEPTREAEDSWTQTCREIADLTLFPKAQSWIFGANIPGKTNTVMFYLAGLGNYRAKLAEVASNGYEGFDMRTEALAHQG
ncbi:flavin-containing monooxygenase [Rhodococcus sp. MSC1_016]|jgi:cyclohexanone monooxygenase|uniref:flavin-containing monooxygenase n=1 Tax=Rhodococcus sp. MSC1_016 TaxID=2909266 RepID=UPI0020306EA1|nr:NAD(P)/FAD-dependent oxidoreductase [Rhodococcus sp. MSC1_016]